MTGRTGWTAVIYVPVFLLLATLAGCRSLPPENAAPVRVASRFLLTFDDGPSISEGNNPTVSILEQLANNGVQPNIKAIFFVQTRNRNGGGTEYGRKLLRREHAENHLIGVHSGSPRGHVSHVRMPPEELQESLRDAVEDIAAAGNTPLFVRPPFWAYTADTLALYSDNRLNMLLSDVKAYDGVIWGVNFSLRRRSNIHNELLRVRDEISLGRIPVVDGAAPIVVTFHDPNTFTASHMEEYLQILIEEAERVGLPLSIKPFYDDPTELARAALRRAVHTLPDELPASTIADKTPNRPLPLEPSADNAITLPRPDDILPPRNHGG